MIIEYFIILLTRKCIKNKKDDKKIIAANLTICRIFSSRIESCVIIIRFLNRPTGDLIMIELHKTENKVDY